MKKIFYLLLLTASFSFGQTTMDEYNYMTKGYKIQKDSGLDMKKGYVIEDLGVLPVDSYNFTFKSLLRTNKTLAGIIVIAESKVWGNVYYYGIPLNNPDLLVNYANQISELDKPMITAYSKALSIYTGLFADLAYQHQAKTNK